MECAAASVGFDFWKGITVFLTATTAAVAYQQYDVARNKLKLDLFEKRFKVVEALRLFLSQAHGKGEINEDDLNTYRIAIFEAPYLFEQDLVDYLQNVWSRGIDLKALTMAPHKEGNGEKWAQHMREFSQELKSITDRFSPYMAFGKWKDG